MIRQAVILAGGLGTRMRPYTEKTPKPMVPIGGRPFLEYMVSHLKKSGIKDIVICASYLHEHIEEHFGNGAGFGVKIRYSVEPEPLGTGGALKLAEKLLDSKFVLLYGDNFWPLNYRKIFKEYEERNTDGLMMVFDGPAKATKDNVAVSGGHLTRYDKSRTAVGLKGIDGGLLLFKKKITKLLPEGKSSLEETVYPELIKNNQFAAMMVEDSYYHVSVAEKLPALEKAFRDFRSKHTVFLDRDGVINKKMPKADYVKKRSEFEFLPGAIDAVRLLGENAYSVLLVTNQSGIARGAMTEADLADIHSKMVAGMEKHGAYIDKIYYCPHGWHDGCKCRKPATGMVDQAAKDFSIDPKLGILIGDDDRDMEMAKNIGCKGIQVADGNTLLGVAKEMTKRDSK
jgi:D-glycero-D-manno-heptose 1,7-bisphosphate phosphatase